MEINYSSRVTGLNTAMSLSCVVLAREGRENA